MENESKILNVSQIPESCAKINLPKEQAVGKSNNKTKNAFAVT